MRKLTERGDTLVEVLLAVTILATSISMSYTIMTRMFAVGMVALERSQTQAILNGQAALLRDAQHRYLTGGDATDWNDIATNRIVLPAQLQEDGCTPMTGSLTPTFTTSGKWFFLDPTKANGVSPFKTVVDGSIVPSPIHIPRTGTYPSYNDGIWIEGVKYSAGGQSYYDFYLKACWDSPYASVRQQMKTVVRIFDAKP